MLYVRVYMGPWARWYSDTVENLRHKIRRCLVSFVAVKTGALRRY